MRYLTAVLAIGIIFFGFKVYSEVLSKDVDFGMGKLIIKTQAGEEIKLDIKVADSQDEHAQGLMRIKELGEYSGMLFIFDREENRKMWMENTYIPLDMLFVNGDKTIFNFKENATPLSREIIYSVGPAKYVVELNGGFVKKHGIKTGDKIEFEI
jgi:uncharacterized membrane protein (UPF0127 family)